MVVKLKKQAVIQLIDSIESSISNQPRELMLHFYYLKSILKQSIQEDRVDLAKIREAIHYLETIPVKSSLFAKNRTLATELEKQGLPTLPESVRDQLPPSLGNQETRDHLNPKFIDPLVSIHQDICTAAKEHLQYAMRKEANRSIQIPKPAWKASNALNENHEIMGQGIGEWQNQQMEVKTDKEGAVLAHEDFTRDCSIMGMKSKTDDDINCLIEHLLNESSYPDANKAAISAWLHANGGQNSNRFVDLMLANGEIIDANQAATLKVTPLEQNWDIEDGKIVFNYDVCINSLNFSDHAVQNSANGHLQDFDPENQTKVPLLRVQSRLQLELEDGVVKPTIVALNVTGYSPDLTCAETTKNTPLQVSSESSKYKSAMQTLRAAQEPKPVEDEKTEAESKFRTPGS